MFTQSCDFPDGSEKIRIVFVSDLHIGLSGFREDIFDSILEELDKPNTYWIGGGDMSRVVIQRLNSSTMTRTQ